LYGGAHRVDSVPGFLSSRPNWVPPPPQPQATVAPPACGEGGGRTQFGRGDRHSGTQSIVHIILLLWCPYRKRGSKYEVLAAVWSKVMFLILILLHSKARWCHAKLNYNLTLFTTLTFFILFSTYSSPFSWRPTFLVLNIFGIR
jgi:hypothetical protein